MIHNPDISSSAEQLIFVVNPDIVTPTPKSDRDQTFREINNRLASSIARTVRAMPAQTVSLSVHHRSDYKNSELHALPGMAFGLKDTGDGLYLVERV